MVINFKPLETYMVINFKPVELVEIHKLVQTSILIF